MLYCIVCPVLKKKILKMIESSLALEFPPSSCRITLPQMNFIDFNQLNTLEQFRKKNKEIISIFSTYNASSATFRHISNSWCLGSTLWLLSVTSVIVVWYTPLVPFTKGKNFTWWPNNSSTFVPLKNVSLGMALKINTTSFKFVLLIFYRYI